MSELSWAAVGKWINIVPDVSLRTKLVICLMWVTAPLNGNTKIPLGTPFLRGISAWEIPNFTDTAEGIKL